MTENTSAYAQAGVDIEAGNRSVELMKSAVQATHGMEVLAGVGSFGGLFSAAALKEMERPVLVASTDGVGTKVMLAAQSGRYAGIGKDIVNHCLDDILVQGARPLFFLDYFASSKLNPEMVAEVVRGMAEACQIFETPVAGNTAGNVFVHAILDGLDHIYPATANPPAKNPHDFSAADFFENEVP